MKYTLYSVYMGFDVADLAVTDISDSHFDTLIPDDNSVVETPTKVVPINRRASGRARFAEGICNLHPGGTIENPCPKFGHLRGDGRGHVQPGPFKMVRVILRAIFKPIFWLVIVYFAGSILIGWIGGALQFGGGLPIPNSSVPASIRPTPDSGIPSNRPIGNSIPTSSIPSPTAIRP